MGSRQFSQKQKMAILDSAAKIGVKPAAELAQMDILEFFINKLKVYMFLLLDDFSRFILGWRYEVRKYKGWHHHMLTSMLAHFFLWHLKFDRGKKAPSIILSQLSIRLEAVLPLQHYDVDSAIELVLWIKKKKHAVYLSHRSKRIKKLIESSYVSLYG